MRAAAPESGTDGDRPETRKKKTIDWFMLLYVGPIVLVLGGALGYELLIPRRVVTGLPLVADVNGDGVEDLIAQWDEDLHGSHTARVGLIDGKTRKIVWSNAFSPKKYANPLPMALGRRFLIVGDPKPIATIVDVTKGAVLHTLDLPDTASRVYTDGGYTAWIDMNGKAREVDVQVDEGPRTRDSSQDARRPFWAPFDAGQTCPQATCRSNAPMPIADMNVHQIYLDGTSDEAVAIGQKENGTHLPMLAGIALGTKTTRWTRVLTASEEAPPQHPVIAGERIYFAYLDGARRHLACASIATGEMVWDVTSDEHAARSYDLAVGKKSVYLRRGSQIEIHDAKTGAVIASVP